MSRKSSFVLIFCIIMISPFFVNGIMLIKGPYWFPASDNNDWIGFYGNLVGSLIGAAATIFVFVKSIQHAERKDSTDRRISVLPFMNLKILDTELTATPDGVEIQLFVRNGDPESILLMGLSSISTKGYESIMIEIQNIGIGLATNVGISKFGEVKEIRFNPREKYFDSSSSYLQGGASTRLLLLLPMEDQKKSTKDLVINFKDILGNYYEQTYQIVFYQQDKLKKVEGYDRPSPTYLIYIRQAEEPRLIRAHSLD